ncbi:hypothetical protein [Halobellus sp. GM3]|uniref:hypothetical protein n=1 Tax=Halobellus sp. GM3 TaxID=3458410 RepID=UPI00403D58D9
MEREEILERLSRRTVLKGAGTATVIGAVGGAQLAGAASGSGDYLFAVTQGETCTEIEPLRGDEDVVDAYGYEGDIDVEDPRQANLPSPLEEAQTSRLFLYDGPEGLSLVFVQGGDDDPGGAATVLVCGLPVDGEWVVLDDSYGGATDEFLLGDQEAVLNWAWGSSGRNDGAVFRGLEAEEFCLSVKSVFGEDAKLDPFGDGDGVTDWQFLSGDIDDPEVIELDPEEPITIRPGSCDDAGDEHGRDDACAMNTVIVEDPFEAEVTFCCTTATVNADEYDRVRLNFLNGTDRRFDGPFDGTNGFRDEDDDTNNREHIIRSLVIEAGDESATVENPGFERCRDLVTQDAFGEKDDETEAAQEERRGS